MSIILRKPCYIWHYENNFPIVSSSVFWGSAFTIKSYLSQYRSQGMLPSFLNVIFIVKINKYSGIYKNRFYMQNRRTSWHPDLTIINIWPIIFYLYSSHSSQIYYSHYKNSISLEILSYISLRWKFLNF